MGGILVFLVLCWAHFRHGYYFWGISGFASGNDDAFISFRYAQNLIEHGILSFNASDVPYVEGFTNPLHVLLCAAIYACVGPEALYAAVATVSVLCVAGAMLLVLTSPWITTPWPGRVLLAWSMALSPSIWIHTTSGLETAGFLALSIVCWIQAHRASRTQQVTPQLFIASVLMVWMRADGFVLCLAIAAWLWFAGVRRPALSQALGVAAALIVLHTVRLLYYQEWIPNSVIAKVNGPALDRVAYGIRLLASMALKNGFAIYLGVIAIAMVTVIVRVASGRPIAARLEVWMATCLLSFYCLVGGDIYRDRFLLILVPISVVTLFDCKRIRLRAKSLIVLAAIVWQVAASSLFDPRLSWRLENPKFDGWIALGRYLGENHPNELLATSAAGKIPYYSRMTTIDTLGLNDLHIARTPARNAIPGHGRFDPQYVFSRQPRFIADHVVEDGDMVNGMPRASYEANGYDLWLLVRNSGVRGQDMIDVSGRSATEVRAAIGQGYTWGLLRRRS